MIACPWPTYPGLVTLDAALHALDAHAVRHERVAAEYGRAGNLQPPRARGGLMSAALRNAGEAMAHRSEIAAMLALR